jgi:integrase
MAALEEWFRETDEIDEYPFDRIGAKFAELAADLAAFDPISCATAIAALSTIAENRNRMVRLDALLHLAATHCQGTKQPTIDSLNRWLNQMLAGTAISRREDPAEDVAIGNIMTTAGNYRVFLGDSSNPDYYAQDVLDALQKAPVELDSLREECHSLLKLSDLLVERRAYVRNEGEAGDEISDVSLPVSDDALWALCETVLIGADQLKSLGIQEQTIAPFTLTFEEFRKDSPRRSMRMVRRQPVIQLGDQFLIAHPTVIAWAITAHVFTNVRQKNMLGGLENSLGGLQAYRTFRLSTQEIERQDMLTSKLPSEDVPPAKYVSQAAFRFDGNKYMHLLFLHDDVYDIEANGITANWFPPFVRHCYVNIRSITRMAKKLNFLATDPGLDVTMPQTKPVPKPIMNQEQIIALIGGIEDLHDLCLVYVGIFCGPRASEVLGLQWKSWTGATLVPYGTAYEGNLYPGRFKTRASRAPIGVPALVRPVIHAWQQVCPDPSPEALMLPTFGRGERKGQAVPRWGKNFLTGRIRPIARQLGIPDQLVTFQVMRRTLGTHLQHHGTLKDAQGALRHASIQTTGDVYMQAIEGSVLQALNSRTSEILSDWKPTLVSGGQPINGVSAAPKRRTANLARGLDQNGPSAVLKEGVSA